MLNRLTIRIPWRSHRLLRLPVVILIFYIYIPIPILVLYLDNVIHVLIVNPIHRIVVLVSLLLLQESSCLIIKDWIHICWIKWIVLFLLLLWNLTLRIILMQLGCVHVQIGKELISCGYGKQVNVLLISSWGILWSYR